MDSNSRVDRKSRESVRETDVQAMSFFQAEAPAVFWHMGLLLNQVGAAKQKKKRHLFVV